MEIRIRDLRPWEVEADVLVLPLAEDAVWEGTLGELDRRNGGELQRLQAFGEVKGKRYQTALAAAGGLPVERILTVGIGRSAALDRETVVRAAAAALRRLSGRNGRRIALWLEPLAGVDGGGEKAVELTVRGLVEGSYDPQARYRTSRDEAPALPDELVIVGAEEGSSLDAAAERGRIIGEGANLARDLSNRAANDLSPAGLAEEARAVAAAHGLAVEVIDEGQAAELGMGMFLAVGRGSDNPPRLIVLRSGDPGAVDARGRLVAMVGKGVCFDAGGISLKPADRMEEMKMDKTGACTVIAAAATVARLAPGTPFLALAPAVENLPGPHSTRPGDIVRALNGKTVDIVNTDAEGRLILGDALTYAERLGATHLVDVATLTGAMARALGDLVTGGFGQPDSWWAEVEAAAGRAGERLWRLPLVEDYVAELESWYADLQNIGIGEGTLVKSALFIREFVSRPWVHLDIGGTAYFRRPKPFAPRGATGVTHATLVELLLSGAAG
jgi:leucyl aminopeptidase